VILTDQTNQISKHMTHNGHTDAGSPAVSVPVGIVTGSHGVCPREFHTDDGGDEHRTPRGYGWAAGGPAAPESSAHADGDGDVESSSALGQGVQPDEHNAVNQQTHKL